MLEPKPEPNLLENWGRCFCGWKGRLWIGEGASTEAARHEAREHLAANPDRTDHTTWVECIWRFVES